MSADLFMMALNYFSCTAECELCYYESIAPGAKGGLLSGSTRELCAGPSLLQNLCEKRNRVGLWEEILIGLVLELYFRSFLG